MNKRSTHTYYPGLSFSRCQPHAVRREIEAIEAQFDITLPAAYFDYLAEIHAIDISPAWFPVTYSNGSTEWASVEAMYCLNTENCNKELPRAIAFYRNDAGKKIPNAAIPIASSDFGSELLLITSGVLADQVYLKVWELCDSSEDYKAPWHACYFVASSFPAFLSLLDNPPGFSGF